jgi:hypothetical protein
MLKIFSLKRKKVTGGWKQMYSEKLHNLYPSNVTMAGKLRRVRWAGQLVRMEHRRNEYNISVGRVSWEH